MPTMVDRLEKGSDKGRVSAAISDCIATEIRAGRDPEQAKAMCYSMAREKTGGSPPEQGGA